MGVSQEQQGTPAAAGPGTVKVMTAVRRAPGTPVEAFRERLATDPGPEAGVAGALRHARSVTTASGYRKGDPHYDAVEELWFADEPAARAAVASSAFAALLDALGVDHASVATFLVEDHLIKDGPVRDGALKNFEFVTRRPGITPTEFRRYWREHHGPLASGIEWMRRYVQSHTIDSDYVGGEPAWEGSAITWFDDLDAMRVSATDPVYAATRADEAAFLGAPLKLPFIITTERVLVG